MQYRTKVEVRFVPTGEEEPGPVKQFRLERSSTKQARRSEREIWRDDVTADNYHTREVMEDLTRAHLVALIADAADWLAYVEEGLE